MADSKPKGKPLSSSINAYRQACRDLIARHRFTGLRGRILLRLVDYVNKHTWDAFVGEETLAKDCHCETRTVRRALEDAKRLGIIQRTRRGNQYVGASHHVFRLSVPDSSVLSIPECTGHARQSTGHSSPNAPDRRVPLTPEKITPEITLVSRTQVFDLEDSRKGSGEQSEPDQRAGSVFGPSGPPSPTQEGTSKVDEMKIYQLLRDESLPAFRVTRQVLDVCSAGEALRRLQSGRAAGILIKETLREIGVNV